MDYSEEKTFDEFDLTGDKFDTLEGDSMSVLAGAYFMDTAQAISENDLLTSGVYPIHERKGEYRVEAEKFRNGTYKIWFHVMDRMWDQWKHDVRVTKEMWENKSDDTTGKPVYLVPRWAQIMILIRFGVHDSINELAFEEVLAKEFPDCWICPSRMPRKLII